MNDKDAITGPATTLARLRVILLGLVALGLAGTAVELTLLAHDEDLNQFIPFVAIGVGLVAIAWRLAQPRRAAVHAVRVAMLALVVTGAVGVVLHYRGNMEFQLELDPSLSGMTLIMKVLEAKAPPALAPANMALLGFIGLAGVHRDATDDTENSHRRHRE
jgi:hypothetical protein